MVDEVGGAFNRGEEMSVFWLVGCEISVKLLGVKEDQDSARVTSCHPTQYIFDTF
jgi:hypothetical protein